MRTQAVISHVTGWLKDCAPNARAKGLAIGISGGIDSIVVSAPAARTSLSVLLLGTPIRQETDQSDRAQEHIRDLTWLFPNVSDQTIDLIPTFNTFAATIEARGSEFPDRQLALTSARSCPRVVTLCYYGQLRGCLVAGTGSRIEDFGVGLFIKYDDGDVDIGPIVDLIKTQVYRLVAELDVAEFTQRVIPTSGLWDTKHTDEEQMGASYPELEWAMSVYGTAKPEDFEGHRREVLEIYIHLHKVMQHRVNPIPVCTTPTTLLE